MPIRRALLIILLAAVGICAVTACFALILAESEDILIGLLMTAFFVAVAIGLLLPLTFLTDRPKFRAAGFACMAVVVLVLLCITGMFWSGLSRMSHRFEDLFGMGLAFTLLTGLPAAGALFLVSFKWARVAVWTLVTLAAYAYGMTLLGIVVYWTNTGTGPSYEAERSSEFFLATGLIPYGIGALAALLLVNVGCGDRRYFRWPAIACAAFAAIYGVGLVWADPRDKFFYQSLAILIIIPAACAHSNLVLMARVRANLNWLALLTLIIGQFTGLLAVIASLQSRPDQAFVRFVGAFAVATAASSLVLIVLVFFNRKTGLPPAVSTPMSDMELTCPRCGDRQTVGLGNSVCKACELRISISVVEPRCPGCGYLLFRLTSDRCPECGAVVRNRAAPQSATGVLTGV